MFTLFLHCTTRDYSFDSLWQHIKACPITICNIRFAEPSESVQATSCMTFMMSKLGSTMRYLHLGHTGAS